MCGGLRSIQHHQGGVRGGVSGLSVPRERVLDRVPDQAGSVANEVARVVVCDVPHTRVPVRRPRQPQRPAPSLRTTSSVKTPLTDIFRCVHGGNTPGNRTHLIKKKSPGRKVEYSFGPRERTCPPATRGSTRTWSASQGNPRHISR